MRPKAQGTQEGDTGVWRRPGSPGNLLLGFPTQKYFKGLVVCLCVCVCMCLNSWNQTQRKITMSWPQKNFSKNNLQIVKKKYNKPTDRLPSSVTVAIKMSSEQGAPTVLILASLPSPTCSEPPVGRTPTQWSQLSLPGSCRRGNL